MEDGANGEVYITNSVFLGVTESNITLWYGSDSIIEFIGDDNIFDTHEPTLSPTEPSSVPTRAPSKLPSINPTKIPTSLPTATPSLPTNSPTPPTDNPTMVPTRPPTNAAEFNLFQNVDVEYEKIECLTYPNGVFNPGFKNRFYSKAKIAIQSQEHVSLFVDWFNNGWNDNYGNNDKAAKLDSNMNVYNLSMAINWNIYDSNFRSITDDVYSTVKVSKYTEISNITIENVTNDDTIGIFYIDSYFILYSDTASINQYSSQICDVYDDTHFSVSDLYYFENEISFVFTFDDSIKSQFKITNSETISLQSNAPPHGGTCNLTIFGDASSDDIDYDLYDITNYYSVFNVSCTGWIDNEDGVNVSSNFIKDNYRFMNQYYSTKDWTTVAFSNDDKTHSISAVILDSQNLATCVEFDDINVKLPNNVSFQTNDTVKTSQWLQGIFTQLYSSHNESSNESVTLPSITVGDAAEITLNIVNLFESELDATDIGTIQHDIATEIMKTYDSENITTVNDFSFVIPIVSIPIYPVDNYHDDDDEWSNYSFVANSMATEVLVYVSSILKMNTTQEIEYGFNYTDVDYESSTEFMNEDTAQQTLDVVENIQLIREITAKSNQSIDNITAGDLMVSIVESVGSLALADSIAGESYHFETNASTIFAFISKISTTNFQDCSNIGTTSISLPTQFLDKVSEWKLFHGLCHVNI